MRKKIVAGNWKMNKTSTSAVTELASAIVQAELPESVTVVLHPPALWLERVAAIIKERINLGAQNVHPKVEGAFTGEISATMLKAAGVSYCIVGHSERRQYFAESDAFVATKIADLLAVGITPIVCCGESLTIRENNTYLAFVEEQIKACLMGFTATELAKIVIAYEPIWAIGTGKTATPQQAQEMHAHIRLILEHLAGKDIAAQVPLLYGGSCKPDNAKELFALPDVDGGLIGGAALQASDFVQLIHSF